MAGSGLATAQAKETPAGKSDDKDVTTKTTENTTSTKATENTITTDGSLDKVSEQTMAQFSGTSKEVRYNFEMKDFQHEAVIKLVGAIDNGLFCADSWRL